ncbi:ABC transporter ATP-binding protein [Fundicoccus culcitae]|uniref:ABC transporter ATP-binding protein/permease n=1 Tax=Fundicoccus culcitae TaxID=2969821 RepID=A0ABY5P798_9LACT|nr:ABC transporter ATP-binding protein [Fundicoccus culcitae]UUX34409.1 ABC transporter ATP-binding protein/permease [Fundicoccus culcitae]
MKLILHYIRPYVSKMSFGLMIKFIGTIMDLLLPWILAHIIDNVIPLKDTHLILYWGLAMLLASVTAVVFNIVANRMASAVARDSTETLRHDLFEKIAYLSANQIDKYGVSTLVSRLTTDTYNVNTTIGRMQRIGIRAPILLLGGILVTLKLDPVLTLVLLAAMPFIVITVYFISKIGIPQFSQLQTEVDHLIQIVRENITGARVIKALSKEQYENRRFEATNEKVVVAETKANLTMAINSPLMNLILNISLTLVILVSAYRVNAGMTQPGVIIAFMSYFTIILNAMLSITRIFVIMSRGIASADRIEIILNEEEDLQLMKLDMIETEQHIEFEHVSFAYYHQKNTLNDIHFSVKEGETLGIIGPTGSGKTTIIKLLMRLYDVEQGTIRIKGQNIKSIPKDELYAMFGVAFQKDFLKTDSIQGNIDFGRGLNLNRIHQSTGFAQADEFIDSLDDGLQHAVHAKGSNLSGGQKQRLIVSRALAGSPDILILDDSSSALDYQTDAKLRQAIHQNFKLTTKIIIAQRISSIQHADHIMVLENGRIQGFGNHQTLLASNEHYRHINQSQMGGGIHAE